MSRGSRSGIIAIAMCLAFILGLLVIAYAFSSNTPTYTEECELLAIEVENTKFFQAHAFFSDESNNVYFYVITSVKEFKELRPNIGETYMVTHNMGYVHSIEKGGKD